MKKVCTKCNIEKEIEEFHREHLNHPKRKPGHVAICKTCANERRIKNYRKTHPEKNYVSLHPGKRKSKEWNKSVDLKKNFNITIQDYNEMFDEQKGCCNICGRHQSLFKRALFVDHNHETGKVRSLLCHYCNSVLGFSKENVEILQDTIDYINFYNKE